MLIDESELTFDKGLTCITGEAGAGKSIILGAIGLVLGDRADTRLCFDKDEKSIIEAAFEFDDDNFKITKFNASKPSATIEQMGWIGDDKKDSKW